MSLFDQIRRTSSELMPHIVLSEGEDARILEAAKMATRDGIARISLVGDVDQLTDALTGFEGAEKIGIHDPRHSNRTESYAQAYEELRRHKGITMEQARAAVETRLGYAAMMVRQGDGDGTIGGAVETTADTVRTALQVIGVAPGVDVVSSSMLMLLKAPHERAVTFTDCGLIVLPSAKELASIAIASAKTHHQLTGEEPRVAMLCFSTMGSAPDGAHESISRIRQAISIVRERAPDLLIDGEMQFDAALLPEIAERKAPGSKVAGAANIFVFPDLNAGNIGYKIAERLGGAVALGPILQGLAKPANDLSRGCSAQDVYQMIAVTGAVCADRSTGAGAG